MKKLFLVWSAILLSFFLEYGVPVLYSYVLFADPNQVTKYTWGISFISLLIVIFIFFFARIRTVFHNIKVGYFKLTIRQFFEVGLFYIAYSIVGGITIKADDLIKLIIVSLISNIFAYIIKIILIAVDRDYIQRIGVF